MINRDGAWLEKHSIGSFLNLTAGYSYMLELLYMESMYKIDLFGFSSVKLTLRIWMGWKELRTPDSRGLWGYLSYLKSRAILYFYLSPE